MCLQLADSLLTDSKTFCADFCATTPATRSNFYSYHCMTMKVKDNSPLKPGAKNKLKSRSTRSVFAVIDNLMTFNLSVL